jgi:hypothetical protein
MSSDDPKAKATLWNNLALQYQLPTFVQNMFFCWKCITMRGWKDYMNKFAVTKRTVLTLLFLFRSCLLQFAIENESFCAFCSLLLEMSHDWYSKDPSFKSCYLLQIMKIQFLTMSSVSILGI